MIREHTPRTPRPRAFVVSGRLEETGHGAGRFRLLVGSNSLPGRLDRRHLDVALLRPLWGKPVTVQGIVHFKADGRPRLIEARRIGARAEGDGSFETMPAAGIGGEAIAGLPTEPGPGASAAESSVSGLHRVDPMVLWGAWPGYEPVEELLAELD